MKSPLLVGLSVCFLAGLTIIIFGSSAAVDSIGVGLWLMGLFIAAVLFLQGVKRKTYNGSQTSESATTIRDSYRERDRQ